MGIELTSGGCERGEENDPDLRKMEKNVEGDLVRLLATELKDGRSPSTQG